MMMALAILLLLPLLLHSMSIADMFLQKAETTEFRVAVL